MLGLFAVTGSPPFGLFLSEFTILNAAIGQGHPWVAMAMIALLALIFVGMAAVVLEVLYRPPETEAPPVRENLLLVAGPIALLLTVLVLGDVHPAAAAAGADRGGSRPRRGGAMTTFDDLGLRNRRAIPLASRAAGDRCRDSAIP